MRPRSILLALVAGLPLLLPTTRPVLAETEACGPTRTVGVGDTLTNIAVRCGVSPRALLEANPQIRDPNVVPLGVELTIPGGSARAGDEAIADPPEGVAGVPPLRVVPIGGPLDGRVRLFATNLPPGAEVLIGGGSAPGEALFFDRARVDETGVLSRELTVPAFAARGAEVHFVVEAPVGGALLRAAPHVLGRVSAE